MQCRISFWGGGGGWGRGGEGEGKLTLLQVFSSTFNFFLRIFLSLPTASLSCFSSFYSYTIHKLYCCLVFAFTLLSFVFQQTLKGLFIIINSEKG